MKAVPEFMRAVIILCAAVGTDPSWEQHLSHDLCLATIFSSPSLFITIAITPRAALCLVPQSARACHTPSPAPFILCVNPVFLCHLKVSYLYILYVSWGFCVLPSPFVCTHVPYLSRFCCIVSISLIWKHFHYNNRLPAFSPPAHFTAIFGFVWVILGKS